jgi:hypothetical protein
VGMDLPSNRTDTRYTHDTHAPQCPSFSCVHNNPHTPSPHCGAKCNDALSNPLPLSLALARSKRLVQSVHPSYYTIYSTSCCATQPVCVRALFHSSQCKPIIWHRSSSRSITSFILRKSHVNVACTPVVAKPSTLCIVSVQCE